MPWAKLSGGEILSYDMNTHSTQIGYGPTFIEQVSDEVRLKINLWPGPIGSRSRQMKAR